MNDTSIYASLKSSDIIYDTTFLMKGIAKLKKEDYAFIRNMRGIMKVPFGKEFVHQEYKNYIRECLLGRDCYKFDIGSNDIYIVATSKGSRREVKKETMFQSGNICGKIVSVVWVNKYINRSFHDKTRKRPHEFLT